MTQSKTVKASSISLPDANGDVTIEMTDLDKTTSGNGLITASNIFTASTYADGTWLTDSTYDIQLKDQTLWEERLPRVNEVNALAEEYPAFAKAYEQFRNAYNLVIDDWKSKDD
jgi:hypothetical protein